MDGETYTREHLIGPRFPENPATQYYYPDAEFVPHPVKAIRSSIWFNQRRLVNLTLINNEEASAILTLFIPFSEEEPKMFFETIHLLGVKGWIMRKAPDLATARANHEAVTRELCVRYGIPFPINYSPYPAGRQS